MKKLPQKLQKDNNKQNRIKSNGPSDEEIEKIISIFNLRQSKKTATKLIKSLYEIIIEKDASLIEINPLIITKI